MKLQGFNSDLFKVSSEETSLITGGYGCTTKLESKGSTYDDCTGACVSTSDPVTSHVPDAC
jgi:hypothetical protein